LSQVTSPSQTSGPLFGYALLWDGSEAAVDPSRADAITLSGHLYDGEGAPVAWPEAMVEVWVADQFARTRTDHEGRFEVVVAKPVLEPLGDDLPQAPHVNIQIFARGLLKQVVTRAYFADEPAANASDAVLAAVAPELRERLLAQRDEHGYHLDIFLQGERESVFFEF
jgi:protocatechuate 3,4-dioxygenase, alpha subunit